MRSSRGAVFFSGFLIAGLSWASQTHSDFGLYNTWRSAKGIENLKKRSALTFPPGSVFQVNMGVSLAGQFEKNSAAVVLAFQQNGNLPVGSDSIFVPSAVASARTLSVYDYLRDVISSYGFDGTECLRKMVCQIGETPLPEGLLEDVITFVLSPSAHRSLQLGKVTPLNLGQLLESERLGKHGGNCSAAYPQCVKTPLDLVSAFIHI